MQLGLQVLSVRARLHFLYGTKDVLYVQPVQLETVEQNNQILNNLGSLDSKTDSVSSRVDSVGFGVQLVQVKVQGMIDQQDSHHKKVHLMACI